jgi:hypothetical protein
LGYQTADLAVVIEAKTVDTRPALVEVRVGFLIQIAQVRILEGLLGAGARARRNSDL